MPKSTRQSGRELPAEAIETRLRALVETLDATSLVQEPWLTRFTQLRYEFFRVSACLSTNEVLRMSALFALVDAIQSDIYCRIRALEVEKHHQSGKEEAK